MFTIHIRYLNIDVSIHDFQWPNISSGQILPLLRTSAGLQIRVQIEHFFSYFSTETYVVGTVLFEYPKHTLKKQWQLTLKKVAYLDPFPAGTRSNQRRFDVDVTSWHHFDVDRTLFKVVYLLGCVSIIIKFFSCTVENRITFLQISPKNSIVQLHVFPSWIVFMV